MGEGAARGWERRPRSPLAREDYGRGERKHVAEAARQRRSSGELYPRITWLASEKQAG